MRIKFKTNDSIQKAFHYLFVLTIIIECRSIWMNTKGMEWFRTVVLIALGILFICCMILDNRRKMACWHKGIAVSCILAVYLVLFWFVDPTRRFSFLAQIVALIVLVLYRYICENGQDLLFQRYKNIILLIALISLFFWIFGSVTGIIHSSETVYSSWTGDHTYKATPSYYGLYYETQGFDFIGLFTTIRNTAIFTEAPMCSFHFSLAFLIELFMSKKTSKRNCIILLAAILSTFSTTGYLVLLATIIIKMIMSKSKSNLGSLLKCVTVPMVLITVIYVGVYLLQKKLATFSASARIDDFIAGYKAWVKNPIFGNGYANFDAIVSEMSSFRSYNQGFSNSPMMILACGGIWLFVLYIFPVCIGITKILKRRDFSSFWFYVLYLLMFTITVMPFNALTYYIFISFGTYTQRKNHKKTCCINIKTHKYAYSTIHIA